MAKPACCGASSASRKGTLRFQTLHETVNSSCEAKTQGETSYSGGCGSQSGTKQQRNKKDLPVQKRWVIGLVETSAGSIQRVSTQLDIHDVLGSWKCRWSNGRMDYRVDSGLYCVGSPDEQSPILVTSNYKMTFDRLRKELDNLNAWILVLDTDGVNVWCAAGKGTFSTDELVYRINAVQLGKVVSQRKLIVPQLGATGIAAHEVLKRSGFSVVFGPVRASDVKSFLADGLVASEEMRTVKFPILDRLVLTPMELITALKPMLIVFGVLFILNAIGLGHYGRIDLVALLGALVIGCVVTPVLLPWIPGRAFSLKGFLLGLLWAIAVIIQQGFPGTPAFGWMKAIAYLLVLPALSSFLTLNFTGSSTYTSLSGVDSEMKIALPSILIATAAGVILLLVNDCISVFG